VKALLYDDGTKQVSLIQLGDAYEDPDFLSSDDNKDDNDEQQALNAHLDRLQTSNSIEDQGESSVTMLTMISSFPTPKSL
jgi:hypothetical protein